MPNKVFGLLLALGLMATGSCAWADVSATVAVCSVQKVSLATSARVFRVESETMPPEQVMKLPDDAFRSIVSGRYLGHVKGVWWLRFNLHNSGTQSCERWLVVAPSRVGDVRVYVRDDTGWKRMVAGASYAFRKWAIHVRQPVFPVQLKPGVTTVLAQVVNKGEALALTPQLWAPELFLKHLNRQALVEGWVGGSIIVLVLVSLILSYLYRRPPLLYMALANGLYVIHAALSKNYLLVYLWPDWTAFNHWARFFIPCMYFVAFLAYLYTVVRINRLSRWSARLFYWALSGFVLLGSFGGLATNAALISFLEIALYEVLIWLLAFVVIYNLLSGTNRHWFPPVLIGAVCLQSIVIFGPLVGLNVDLWGAEYVAAPMILILSVFLLGTMFSQARKGRLAELRSQAALDKQRATETERLERTVAQRTGELERALKARRQLLGRVSHDLRSPLAGIVNSVRQWRAGDSRHDYPQLIERHANQQMDMIDELLEFSHTEVASLEPRLIPGYLYAFLNEVGEQAELAAECHGNRLQCEFADDLPALVSTEFYYLRRVLHNLLGNAIKFTRHGSIRFAVQAGPSANEGTTRLNFVVNDSGPGIALSDRRQLMQPFARGGNAGQEEGHGLGLAIVTQLLEHMGGQLQIDDAPGGGSRFHFELEVELATESELEPFIEEYGTETDIDGANRAVLVVDDEPQQRELTCDLLNGYGFNSLAVAGGQAAREVLQTRSVSLVLTDQFMEGVNGWGVLQAAREQQPGLPVVLYSSTPPRPPKGAGEWGDFDCTFLKPGNGNKLLHQIVGLIERDCRGN